jgi:acyl-CoA thioesterase-1
MRRALLPVVLALAACSRDAAPAPAPAAPAAAKGPVALFVGDSLTAGYGVDREEAWPTLVGADWAKRGLAWRERDAAVSGATSAGVAEEVAWALTPEVKLVFVCVGGNDGLRGVPPAQMKKNLDALLRSLQKRGVRVALAGMKLPPNYGATHTQAFEAVFPALARELKVPFMPFLLEGVAAVPGLNQDDGIHPNAAGHKKVAAAVEAFLDKEGLLK